MKCKKSVPYLYIISVILLILLISPNIRGDNGITVLTPIENSVYQTGDSCIIRWGINQETFQVDIYLYKDSYQTRTIAIGIVNRRSYEWFIPGVVGESENFQIKVVDHDDPLNYDFSDHFTIHYPPSISIHSPRSDTVWKTGSKYKISWSFQSPISSINIFLFKTSENVLNIAVKASNSGIYYWIIPQSLEESSSYRILIMDYDDSLVYDYSDYFKIESPSENSDNNNGDDNNSDSTSNEYENIPGFNVINFLIITTAALILIIKFYKKRLNISI